MNLPIHKIICKVIVITNYLGGLKKELQSCLVQRVEARDWVSSTMPGHPWLRSVTSLYF